MRSLSFLLVALLHSTAFGQIDVPPLSEPYTVIPATVTAAVPEGATFDGGWQVSEGVSFVEHDAKTIFWTAPPGEHSLSYSGFWVHTEAVTFLDGSDPPKEITIQSYLGSGRVNESETAVVGGADPDDPKPDPDDPPSGPKHIVIYVAADDLDKMPSAQRYLVNSLQARTDLLNRGHRLILVMDDDQLATNSPGKWKPWIDAVEGDELPRIAFAPVGGGEIKDYPLPVDWKHLLELMGE